MGAPFQYGQEYSAVSTQVFTRSEFGDHLVQVHGTCKVNISGSIVYLQAGDMVDLRKVSQFTLLSAVTVTVVDPETLKCIIPWGFFFRVM